MASKAVNESGGIALTTAANNQVLVVNETNTAIYITDDSDVFNARYENDTAYPERLLKDSANRIHVGKQEGQVWRAGKAGSYTFSFTTAHDTGATEGRVFMLVNT